MNSCYYRSFLEERCKDQNLPIPDWENWKYIHKTVCHSLVIIINLEFERMLCEEQHVLGITYQIIQHTQDQPIQTNGFDCGVFASQV